MVAFEIVVIVVCVVSAVVSIVAFARASRLYDRIGKLGVFSLVHDDEVGSDEADRLAGARGVETGPARRQPGGAG